MQMSCAQLIGVALAAAGWSSGFRGNFESRKRALTVRAAARLRRHFLRDVPARGVKKRCDPASSPRVLGELCCVGRFFWRAR